MYKIAKHKSHQPDYVLLGTVIFLVILGLAILASASVVLSQEQFGESYYFLKHQFIYSIPLGFLFLFLGSTIYFKYWQKASLFLLIASIILVALVFIPSLSYEYGGAKRWLLLGPISIQPSEIAKLAFIIYLAALLDKKRDQIKEISQGLLPFLIVVGILALLLILQPDVSTLLVIVAVGFVVFFLAGAKFSHLAAIVATGVASLLVLIKMAPYRMQRFTVFLHPEIDPQGIGYQINQALLAIGAGGLFGRGLGHSVQKYLYLPEAIGDSIFAIAAEELGLIGAAVIVALFSVIALRGFRIAKNAPDSFSRLLAAGITTWIVFQAFINIAAISGLIPLTGIPLPFISYGSSSTVMLLAAVGILLNISKNTVRI